VAALGEPNDFDDAFAAMDREPPDAILMVSDALTILNGKRVFECAAAHRLPTIYENDPSGRRLDVLWGGYEGILGPRRLPARSDF
jgi:hypothetical protein